MAIDPLVFAPPANSALLACVGVAQNWFSQCTAYAPSGVFQSRPKGSKRNSRFIAPLAECLGFATISQVSIVAPVKHLSSLRSPAHVAWFIVAVVIYSIQAISGRTRADLREKCLESVKFWRNLNASAAIVGVLGVFRISTTRQHIAPCGVFRRMRHSMRCIEGTQGELRHGRS